MIKRYEEAQLWEAEMLKKMAHKRMMMGGLPVRVDHPSKYVIPASCDINAIKAMPVYEDDIWIVTPPKCGTTWTQEIVWHMLNGVDAEGALINQFYRVPFVELGFIKPPVPCEYPEELPKNEENLHK